MSNIINNKSTKDIKKKLSFDDYGIPATQHDNKPVSQEVVKLAVDNTVSTKASQQEPKESCCHAIKATCKHDSAPVKIKATYYLNSEANKQITDVYINRLKNEKKIDRSALICEAIKLLYKSEF